MLGCTLHAAGLHHRSKSTWTCTAATWWGTHRGSVAALRAYAACFVVVFCPVDNHGSTSRTIKHALKGCILLQHCTLTLSTLTSNLCIVHCIDRGKGGGSVHSARMSGKCVCLGRQMLGCTLHAAGLHHRSKSTWTCTAATWWGTVAVWQHCCEYAAIFAEIVFARRGYPWQRIAYDYSVRCRAACCCSNN
jgi:hypothetical protein